MALLSKKFLAVSISLTLALVSSPSALGANVANGKCPSPGKTSTIGGAKYICTKSGKKLMWKKVAVASTPNESNKKPSVPGNPVIARINAMLKNLPRPEISQAPKVDWIYPADSNLERVKILQKQHQRMSNQYPEYYRWEGTAIAIIESNPTKILEKLVSAKCGDGYIQSVKRLEADASLSGAGTSFCQGQLFAYFMDRNVSDQKWNFVIGSEYGGIIQQNMAAAHKFKNFPNSNWYSEAPNWYAEGGQTLISVIAEAVETRKWSYDLRLDGGMQGGDWCMSDTLINNRCSSVIGIAAVELAIALYGWDAPLTLFKFLEPNMNQAMLFESGFPDTFAQFNEWSVAYLQYLRYGKELPASLITRLNS